MRGPSSRLRIIVTGLIAQHPLLGGVTWDYVQYPLGLARLGHDVYYLEDSGEWPYNLDGGPTGQDWVERDCSRNVAHLASVMARFGLADRWAYRFPLDGRWFGLSDATRREIVRTADLLINVSGTLERPEEYRDVARLAYIDSDPIFTQIKWLQDEVFRRRVDAHDVHFSFGERVGETPFNIGHGWSPTRQPIVLSEWITTVSPRDAFTTVMSWTSYKPLVHDNRTYGQKDAEFLRFLDLPRRVDANLEVAVSGVDHINWQSAIVTGGPVDRDVRPRELLTQFGWNVVDAIPTCSGLDGYRDYIQSSKAEWSVAKQGYVAGQSGWFSCRSASYLAAGRPVVVQDTGLRDSFPIGGGLLCFSDIPEAEAAVRRIGAEYSRHARAARAIAIEYFDSTHVLTHLVDHAFNADSAVEAARKTGSIGEDDCQSAAAPQIRS